MKVVAAINGKIIAEGAALYALKYAKLNGFTLVLLHIKNNSDDFDEVQKSMQNIEEIALEYGIQIEKEILEGDEVDVLSRYVKATSVDMFFCSTRARKRFFSKSFSEHLIKESLPVDIAVVRIVHVNSALNTSSIIMPIKDARLSVHKFTFLTEMAKANDAKCMVLSISVLSKNRLSKLTINKTKQMLKKIDENLSHYFKIARMLGIAFKIKHAACESESKTLLSYLGSGEYQLMIIGGQRLSFFSRLLGEKPIESIFRETSINAIAYYSKSDS